MNKFCICGTFLSVDTKEEVVQTRSIDNRPIVGYVQVAIPDICGNCGREIKGVWSNGRVQPFETIEQYKQALRHAPGNYV